MKYLFVLFFGLLLSTLSGWSQVMPCMIEGPIEMCEEGINIFTVDTVGKGWASLSWSVSGGMIQGSNTLPNVSIKANANVNSLTVTLVVKDASDSTTSCTKQVVVRMKSDDPVRVIASKSGICLGDSVSLTLDGGGGGTNTIVEWFSGSCNGAPVGTGNPITVIPPSGGSITYSGRYKDSGICTHITNCMSATIIVNIPSSAPVSAKANPDTVCAGSACVLSLQGGTPGTNAKIVWYKDACETIKVGEGNNLSTGPLSASTTFFGRYEDPAPCNTNTICRSVSVIVQTKSTNPVSAQANPDTVCAGSACVLSLQGGTPGTNAKIVWYKDACGTNKVGEGDNLSTGPLSVSTTFFGRYEDSAPCNTNTICRSVRVIVNTKSTNPVSAQANPDTVCAGSASLLSLQGGALGTNAKIVWYRDACGTNKVGEGNGFPTGALTTTTTFFGRYEDPAPCNSNTICQSVTVMVNSRSTNPSRAEANPPVICSGSSSMLTLQGGSLGTNAKVVWYKDACGINKFGEGNGLTTGALTTSTTFFGRYEDPLPCGSQTTCQEVSVTVVSSTANSILSGDETICKNGDPSIIDGSRVTGNATTNYQWLSSLSGCSGPFSPIPGATSEDYNPPPGPNATLFYKRNCIMTLNGVNCPVAESNCTAVQLNFVDAGLISPPTQRICPKELPAPINSQSDGTFTGAASYSWVISGRDCNSGFAPLSGSSRQLSLPVLQGNSFLKRIATSTLNGVVCKDSSNCVSIFHNPAPTAIIRPTNPDPNDDKVFEFFSNDSRSGGANVQIDTSTIFWEITDGNVVLPRINKLRKVFHRFQNPGINRVCLGLENSDSCPHDTCLNITVQNDSCKDFAFRLEFNPRDSVFCEGEKFQLSANFDKLFDIPPGITCTLRVNFNNGRSVVDRLFTTGQLKVSNPILLVDFSDPYIRLDSLNSVTASIQVAGTNPSRILFDCFDELRFFVFRKPSLQLTRDSFCVSTNKDSLVTINLNFKTLDPLKEYKYTDTRGVVKVETKSQISLEPLKDTATLIRFNLETINGCKSDTISETIFAFTIPNLDSIPEILLVCENKNAVIDLKAKNHPGFYTYNWSYRDGAGPVTGMGPGININFNNSNLVFNYVVTNNKSSGLMCSARDSILFRKTPTPGYELKEISPCTGLYYIADRNSPTTDIEWKNFTSSNIANVDAAGLIIMVKGFGSLTSSLSINGNCEVEKTVSVSKLPGDQTLRPDAILRRICFSNSELLVPNVNASASCFRWIIIDTSRVVQVNGKFNYPIEIIDDVAISRDSNYFKNKIVFLRAFDCSNPDNCGVISRLAPRSTDNLEICGEGKFRSAIVFPNPSFGNIDLKLEGFPPKMRYPVTITDILGRPVISSNLEISLPVNVFQIDLPEFIPQGVYNLSFSDENSKIYTFKILLIR